MKRPCHAICYVVAAQFAFAAAAGETAPAEYEKALDLVHSFSGAGDELQRAMAIAESLHQSHPDKGYAQVIVAEMQSTFNLGQDGEPEQLRTQILALADQALRMNPALAQAHVVRGRVFVRMSRYESADKAIEAALEFEPGNASAIFLRADIFRRTGRVHDAEAWYLKFIEATPSQARKANGYSWLARTYEDAAWRNPRQWADLVAKARAAHENGLKLDPGSAWRNVNFAIFLNNQAGDFAAAERHATAALQIMDFPMARYHWAIARYQQLLGRMEGMPRAQLEGEVAKIGATTGISLEDALAFCESCTGISTRLQQLRARLAGSQGSRRDRGGSPARAGARGCRVGECATHSGASDLRQGAIDAAS